MTEAERSGERHASSQRHATLRPLLTSSLSGGVTRRVSHGTGKEAEVTSRSYHLPFTSSLRLGTVHSRLFPLPFTFHASYATLATLPPLGRVGHRSLRSLLTSFGPRHGLRREVSSE